MMTTNHGSWTSLPYENQYPRRQGELTLEQASELYDAVDSNPVAARYNIVAIPLAAGVLSAYGLVLSPAAGAVLMSASTVVVALNAQLLRRIRL